MSEQMCPGCGVEAKFNKVDAVGWFDHGEKCLFHPGIKMGPITIPLPDQELRDRIAALERALAEAKSLYNRAEDRTQDCLRELDEAHAAIRELWQRIQPHHNETCLRPESRCLGEHAPAIRRASGGK